MSNRTSEANKAVALAWVKEQQLIHEGKGTRDWTPAQQQDILDRGKAYSDDGRAFQGHHMKSAEKHPEYQGEPENIQFLSRPEHFSAHDENFQNPTNGCFNPATGETSDFGLNKYTPCDILDLSEPIISTGNQAQKATENTSTATDISTGDANADSFISSSSSNSGKSGFGGTVKRLAGKAVKFYIRHKKVIDPIAAMIGTAAVVAIKETIGGNSKNRNRNYENDDDYATYFSSADASEKNRAVSIQHEDVIERSSPSEHIVSAHRQRYNGEWRDKDPYKRGNNSDE